MKKHFILGILFLCCASMASAAVVTNFNQSALYFRLLSRNASTDIDAVYYNPAGLTELKDGFHIALHNQTILQEKTVINQFIFLNNYKYIGKVNVPFYPNFYAVYKKGDLALSFGFGPNAGGGSVDYDKGLPSFETGIAALPALLTSMGLTTTKYSADIALNAKSVFYGFQANASYALNETISGAVGFRYIYAVNNYEGHIQNILINPVHPALNPTGQMIAAPAVFTAIGQPAYAAATSNKALDVEQTGSGFTPIFGLHLSPMAGMNISAKYEFNTKLELTNKTTKDDTGAFPDGAKTRNDIPAILSFGVEYALMPELRASISFNYTFDKDANWDGREEYVDSNTWDLGVGIEYDITKCISVSAGYLRTKYGLSADYLEDSSFELSSHTFGLGGRLRLGEKLDIDVSGFLVDYQDFTKTINYGLFGLFSEKYKQTTAGVAIGLGYHF